MRALIAAACLLFAPGALAQSAYPPDGKAAADAAQAKTDAAAAQAKADAALAAAQATVKTVNGVSPTSGNVAISIPQPSTSMPPSVSDSGSVGNMTTIFALANHTHASKARRIIASTPADGSYTFNYASNPFVNPPVCAATARVPGGTTDVVNAQIVGTPSTTTAVIQVNRSQRKTTLIDLVSTVILAAVATPGVTSVDIICLEP